MVFHGGLKVVFHASDIIPGTPPGRTRHDSADRYIVNGGLSPSLTVDLRWSFTLASDIISSWQDQTQQQADGV